MDKEFSLLKRCERFPFSPPLWGLDLVVIFICLFSFGCSWIESMVNMDSHHWGVAYVTALDLKRGAIPHSEVVIFYGYLYSWIQSIALVIWGERLMSVGVVTGVFYSLTLFLSYRIFLKFLRKDLAFFCVFFLFLLHPYIIYPAPNYFAYAFQLLSLLFLLKYYENRIYGFLGGLFLGGAVLCRYSSVIAIVPPCIIWLVWEYFSLEGDKKPIKEKIIRVGLGFLVPWVLFFSYLAANSALGAFFSQTLTIIKLRSGLDNFTTYLNFLAYIFLIETSAYAFDFRGKIFTLILVVCLFTIFREMIGKKTENIERTNQHQSGIVAVCLVAVFGFLNSLHVYETTRLVNGVSIGIGIVVLALSRRIQEAGRPVRYFVALSAIALCLFLSASLFFRMTSSAYYPWRKDVLFQQGVKNDAIKLLKGKLMTQDYNDFYQSVYDAIEPFKPTCCILNFTFDVVALLVNDLPRVQTFPVNNPGLYDPFKQARVIEEKSAVILSAKPLDFPGYAQIFCRPWPDEIPWLGGGYLFIYAPQKYVEPKADGHNTTLTQRYVVGDRP